MGVVASCRLLVADADYVLRVTDEVRRVDEREGIRKLLAIVAKHAPADTGDLMPDWVGWLHAETNIASDNSARARLEYLRAGATWSARVVPRPPVERGSGAAQPEEVASVGTATDRRLWDLIAEQTDLKRDLLHERMAAMDPARLEHVVGDLLDAMGYHDVEVTTEQRRDRSAAP